MTLLSEQSYNPLAAKVRHPRQRNYQGPRKVEKSKGGQASIN